MEFRNAAKPLNEESDVKTHVETLKAQLSNGSSSMEEYAPTIERNNFSVVIGNGDKKSRAHD